MSNKTTNTIISIGYLGCMRCYLNVPREEAIRRYMEAESQEEAPDPSRIHEVQVEDEWQSYDGAWKP